LCFFAKNVKRKKILGLNAIGLEIKRRAQRGMPFFDLTIIFVKAATKLNFLTHFRIFIGGASGFFRKMSKEKHF